MNTPVAGADLHRSLTWITSANFAAFAIEAAAARAIGSVSLLADAASFLAAASVGLLALGVPHWSRRFRAVVGGTCAMLIIACLLGALGLALSKCRAPIPPDPLALSSVGAAALAVQLLCSFIVAVHRWPVRPPTWTILVAARYDVLVKVAIIETGVVTAFIWRAPWLDVITGLALLVLNADGAWRVWTAARHQPR